MSPVSEVQALPAPLDARQDELPQSGLSTAKVALFAVACGLAVANIYYTQPLIGLIGPILGLHAGLAGLIVMLTQLGYGAGLLFVVPLSDVIENRRLAVAALGVLVLGLLGIAVSTTAVGFLIASFVVGMFAVATHVLVPFAAHLTPEASRGKVVGNVMSGLLVGIMLARPFSSYLAATLGWRAAFYISAAMMVSLMLLLLRALPQRRPDSKLAYLQILRSMPALVARTPLLRRRAFYQAMMFAGFNVFWTGIPLLLAREFALGQRGIALFALAGAAGALAAPIAGRLADKGLTRPATGWALGTAALAFGIAIIGGRVHSLALLVVAAVILDGAVQICQVLSLRSIYTLDPALRGRLNGLFMAFVFLGGAAGSGLAVAVYESRGWATVGALGALFASVALAQFGSEFRRAQYRISTGELKI